MVGIERIKQIIQRQPAWWRQHWKKGSGIAAGGLAALFVIVQLLYPYDRLPLFTSVEGVSLSAATKSEGVAMLDDRYRDVSLPIFFGESDEAYRTPRLSEVGMTPSNEARVNQLSYPWYLRLVPTSLFWAHAALRPAEHPSYSRDLVALQAYIHKELGSSCSVAPKNATLKAEGSTLIVVPSAPGGTCQLPDVEAALTTVQPTLSDAQVRIAIKTVPPRILDDTAQKLADDLTAKVGDGVTLRVNDSLQLLPTPVVFSWLDFNNTGDQLIYSLNAERASASYLNKEVAPKLAISPGVTTITTHDFTELSRTTGAAGRALDVAATLQNIQQYLQNQTPEAKAATRPIPPTIEYNRTFSPTDTGLSALMKSYAESHPGTYGISLIELGGKRRNANFDGGKQFTSASTYKLFVAYSTLKRVEEDAWQWSDQISGGRDLARCFDDMIVKSDNPCAEALLQKIGFRAVTDEAKALGLIGTSFLGSDGIKTTAGDLSLFLATLQSGHMLTQQASRDRLLDALKRNQYRQGVPAGVPHQVGDKVGFLDGLLHDAAIVYSPRGTYVLTIMSDGASWATIADLAKRIDELLSK